MPIRNRAWHQLQMVHKGAHMDQLEPTARALIADATNRLTRAGVPSPIVDAELLLAHVLGCSRAGVVLSRPVAEDQRRRFNDLVEMRSRRHPLQHLTGVAAFRYLELEVGPGVFVPRPETEILAEVVIRDLRGRRQAGADLLAVVDLCAGSGALSLSIATEVSNVRMTAVELSDDALSWLRRNVERHRGHLSVAGSQVAVIAGDLAAAELPTAVDVVVSNPPYIPDDATPVDIEVAHHDPGLALYGGPDGMDVMRAVIQRAAVALKPGGLLAVEHADVQGDGSAIGPAAIMREHGGWRAIATVRDLAGRPRVTHAYREQAQS
ncbi:MAG: hypothetical protein RL745_46 [Actinomycetota bacterium]